MFKATNRSTGSIIIAPWEDLCDLDKRVWFLEPYIEEESKTPQPLTILRVRTQAGGTKTISVFGLEDLDGLYLGGDNR